MSVLVLTMLSTVVLAAVILVFAAFPVRGKRLPGVSPRLEEAARLVGGDVEPTEGAGRPGLTDPGRDRGIARAFESAEAALIRSVGRVSLALVAVTRGAARALLAALAAVGRGGWRATASVTSAARRRGRAGARALAGAGVAARPHVAAASRRGVSTSARLSRAGAGRARTAGRATLAVLQRAVRAIAAGTGVGLLTVARAAGGAEARLRTSYRSALRHPPARVQPRHAADRWVRFRTAGRRLAHVVGLVVQAGAFLLATGTRRAAAALADLLVAEGYGAAPRHRA